MNEIPTTGKMLLVFAYTMIAIVVILLGLHFAHARDLDGRYANSPLHGWFSGLTTPGGGRCCEEADGTGLDDLDWKTTADGQHYLVTIDGEWVQVPDNKVVHEPNQFGRAVVWKYYQDGRPAVRCFMPGSLG